MKGILLAAFLAIFFITPHSINFGQDKDGTTATFFDDNLKTVYSSRLITITGEIEHPVTVEPDTLPQHSFPFKDVQRNGDKKRFIGSYFVSGVSLYDILKNVSLKKKNEEEFRPLVDLFLIIENDNGDKTVFSWGEIFYSRDNFKSVITKSIVPINPSKGKMEWKVKSQPRLICAYDLTNERFISNPTKIIVKTYEGNYSKERLDNIYSPFITILKNKETSTLTEISKDLVASKFENIGYGHGRGFKGIDDLEGFRFSEVLKSILDFNSEQIKNSFMIFSAKDGYRVTFSLSEIINRNDSEGLVLIDHGKSESNGKFTSFVPSDFFVDRNVRSVEKIEIIDISELED